jgi:hypothetical protein
LPVLDMVLKQIQLLVCMVLNISMIFIASSNRL